MDLIIGAGITGLSYAMFCNHNDYLVLESQGRIGGYCKTTRRNGFVWDYSGHFLHFQDKSIKDIVTENISKEDLLEIVKHTQISYKKRLIDFPFQKNIHQLPKQEFINCLYDLFFNKVDKYDTFQEMLYCKFGCAIADKFLIPYNSKLYACNLNTLDKEAMGRFFPFAEKEDIIRNFKDNNNQSYNSKFVYPKFGAIQYIESIASRLDNEKIHLNCSIEKIDVRNHVAYTNTEDAIKYDRLISTIPFPTLLQMCNIAYDKNIYSWNQVLVFNLGFAKQGNDTQNHWLYFPEKKYSFYRIGFYSNILQQNRMSLYVELGFNNKEQINPTEWLPIVQKDLIKAGILSDDNDLVDYEAIIMNPAYAHINSHSVVDVQKKKQLLAQNDIYSIGRYGSWTYCSIEDNIIEAKELAMHIK